MSKTRLLSLLLVLALALSVMPAALAGDTVDPFTDVPTSAYYAEAVQWAVSQGVTNGKTATTFAPDDTTTRGEIVTFLYRAAGSPAVTDVENPFTDVTSDWYYYNAVLWAVSQGITNGKTATTFAPGDPCTRGEIVTFLYRAAGSPAVEAADTPFTDVDKTWYYYDAVLWAVSQNITNGKTASTFGPGDACTRAHAVTFLYRSQKPADGLYVLMNIPYDKFYAAEGASDVDAVASATKNKTRNNLAAGSYHVNPDGSDITGVIYPVLVEDPALLESLGGDVITNDSSVTITVTNRGTTTETTYEGKDALFEAPSYSYYVLSETPVQYKTLSADGSFSAVSGTAKTVEGAYGDVTIGGRHTNVEIVLSGTEGVNKGDTVSAVVLTMEDGSQVGLRHVVNIWRATELGWNEDEYDLIGQTIKNIRYITLDAIYDYPVDIAIVEPVYVLMNIPYSEFYGAESASVADVDAVASATNKTGNYGKAGGAYHSGVTAEIGEDGTVTAVGGANGSQVKGVIWPVKAANLDAVKALGGQEITSDSSVVTATVGRGQSTSQTLVSYEALTEAPAYSYYVLPSAPGYYATLGGGKLSAVSGRATAEESIQVPVSYGTNWGDVQLDITDAADAAGKLITGIVLTADDGTKVGLYHLDQIWAYNSVGWRVINTPGLDGKTITNIRYYCTVMDSDLTDGAAPEFANYVYDYPVEIPVSQVYTGTVTAEFDEDGSISLAGLPEDAENVVAKVYHTTGGRTPVLTYLTPLVVDPADDDIDPIFVPVTDGEIAITAGSVTNQKGETQTYGEPIDGTTYTIELSSDNYIISKATAVYTAPKTPDGGVSGTFTGSAATANGGEDFDDYNVDVTVVIENDVITAVTAEHGEGYDEESDSYWAWAAVDGRTRREVTYPSVPSQYVGMNYSALGQIDAVSGATYTSNAIIAAVASAIASIG